MVSMQRALMSSQSRKPSAYAAAAELADVIRSKL